MPFTPVVSLGVLGLLLGAGCSIEDGDDSAVDDDDDEPQFAPVVAEDMLDQVYLLDLTGGTFVFTAPEGAGDLLQAFVPQGEGVVFAVRAFDDDEGVLEAICASAWSDPVTGAWQQSPYLTPVVDGTWDNPLFEIVVDEIWLGPPDAGVWLGDVRFDARFLASGTQVVDTHVEAFADLAGADELLGFDPGTLCETAWETSDIQCVACPDVCPHQGEYCLLVEAEGGICPFLADMSIVEYMD